MQQIIELAEIGLRTYQTVSISAPNMPGAGLLGHRLHAAGVAGAQPRLFGRMSRKGANC